MNDRNLQVEFWTVENSGWSGGVSWFPGRKRFSKEEAFDYAKEQKKRINDPGMFFRVVHTKIYHKGNKEITVRTLHTVA